MRLPVVSTAVGGILDFLRHGENGLLVPPRSAEELAGGMLQVMRDASLAARLAEQAWRDVRTSFSAERMASETWNVYERLLKQRPRE